ncbi:hypothetical protein [Paenibacillus sp. GXUN7292]|uniref:hypothetical protein n=1 Tax=Paenibacillus sp. GXUN7292 TaxID=3422499 RepID=UPI003D7E966D
MKKNLNSVIIIFLSLGLIVIGFKYIESQSARKELQSTIDNSFRQQLGGVLGSFSMEVNDYTYRSMISTVSNVSAMSELTSYGRINDNLDISLNYLYISLREEKSKDLVLLRVDELRDIFHLLVQDPSSQEATDKIIEITKEVFFENTQE